jgi:shikimate dehydrogenase
MKVFGLIGRKLSHSVSRDYFEKKFHDEHLTGYRYELIEMERLGEFRKYLEDRPEIRGLNITIPYKVEIMEHLDRIHPDALSIGAVNVVKVLRGFELKGYNTDGAAFANSIGPYLRSYHRLALVLGTGGASRAAVHALKAFGIDCLTVSRSPGKGDLTYDRLDGDLLSRGAVVVNATPAGMYPDTNSCPGIPYRLLDSQSLLFDMVYNPSETLFLKNGRDRGATGVNGLEMLRLQAEMSWRIWMADQD